MSELPPLLLPRTPPAIAGLLAALVNAAMRVAVIPLFVTPLIDRVVGQGRLEALAPLLALAALLVVAGSLALWAQDALLGRAAAINAASWREALYRRLLRRSPGRLPGTSGGLASRVLHDLREVETFHQFGLGTLVAESFTVLGILAVLGATNASATALLVALCLPLVIVLRAVGVRLEAVAKRSQASTEELGTHLQEGLRHHETVRAFDATGFMLGRFGEVNRRTASAMSRRSALAALQIPATQVLAFAALGALVAVLAASAAQGGMTVGEIVSFITLVALLSTPAQLLPRGIAMAQQAGAAAKRLRELAELEPAAKGAPSGDRRPGGAVAARSAANLELRGVEVGHGAEPLLRGVDMRLAGPGLAVLVGESGSGKTTLLRLLLRFHPLERGEVLLGGKPLAAWPEGELRRAVAYVAQGHELLRGTVRDNLALGRNVDDEQLWRVLAEVQLATVVDRLPAGLDYRLGEDGGGLSGGQRQRLALARALLSDPAVLLLDEPTSNLDEGAETELVALLQRQAVDRLVLAATHRPALSDAAERSWRVSAGSVRELGDAVDGSAEDSIDEDGDGSGGNPGGAGAEVSR
ncbi:MAG: ABC transporter ATP-binding protein [Trueperaceae bacterium]